MLNKFKADKEKCIGCGLCVKACPAMLLELGEDSKVQSKPVDKLNWYGCWKCQHCMAVCPEGAISVMGKDPENSLPMWPEDMGEAMDRLVSGRVSTRHFKQENVDKETVNHILDVLTNAPTGGNKMMVEYTVIDDIETMNKLRSLIKEGYKKLREEKIYPVSWDDESLDIMESREEQAMNGDMFFCSAPHLIIPHMPKKSSSATVDVTIAMTYFELLANAHGLGTVYLGFPFNVMKLLPEVWALLGIPEDHVAPNAIGFGYPEFKYARGTQKAGDVKVTRCKLI